MEKFEIILRYIDGIFTVTEIALKTGEITTHYEGTDSAKAMEKFNEVTGNG